MQTMIDDDVRQKVEVGRNVFGYAIDKLAKVKAIVYNASEQLCHGNS